MVVCSWRQSREARFLELVVSRPPLLGKFHVNDVPKVRHITHNVHTLKSGGGGDGEHLALADSRECAWTLLGWPSSQDCECACMQTPSLLLLL